MSMRDELVKLKTKETMLLTIEASIAKIKDMDYFFSLNPCNEIPLFQKDISVRFIDYETDPWDNYK